MEDEIIIQCPRCLRTDPGLFRRGGLKNRSASLPAEERGKVRARKVDVKCLYCGYEWRSERKHLERIQPFEEAPSAG